MSDLISRQAAIDVIDYLLRHNDDAKRKGHSQVFINGMEDGYFRVRSDILSLPSVQPDIIYCKDCKDYHKIPTGEVWTCRYFRRAVMGNDFCSYAERRTDEH